MCSGAVAGFWVAACDRQSLARPRRAMVAGGLLRLLHAVVTIHLRADQVISGLALTFLGTGVALVLGEGSRAAGPVAPLPRLTVPLLADIPLIGPIFFTDQSVLAYVGLPARAAGLVLDRPHPARACTCARWARTRRPPTPWASTSYRLRYAVRAAGGVLAGLAGATITLAITPGWFGDQTTSGRGWIAIGLVIFAQWSPLRAALGAYLFGAILRLILDIQGVPTVLGIPNPFQAGRSATFFLEMLPYVFVIVVLVIGSREAMRRRVGAPAALGIPYVRGERGA